jgi:flagellar motor switch protein FliM
MGGPQALRSSANHADDVCVTLETSSTIAPRRRTSRRGTGPGGPKPYDFRRPTKLSREHVRALQVGYESYARQCTTLITSTLRVVGQMSLISVEQLTYEEYVNSLTTPTVMATLSLEPIQGTGVLEMSLGSAMATVDHLLGGAGGTDQPNRTPTDLEEPLLRRFVDRMLHEFRYAFSALVDWRPAITGVEYNPQFAQVASTSDVMIAASFELKIGVVECVATLCLPFAPVLPLLEAATGRAPASEHVKRQREQAARQVTDRLAQVPLTVGVDVGATTLTPAQVLRLSVGDVVPLQHSITAPMRVTAAGVTFAHAVPGTRGKRLACLVVPQPEEAQSR